MRDAIHRAKAAFAMAAALLAASGCGPEEGTAEYILSKLREGRSVGTGKLEVLGADHLDEMMAVIDDGSLPIVSRKQVLERALDVAGGRTALVGRLLDHAEPQVRIRMAQWMEERGDDESVVLLVARLKVERELAVQRILARAVQNIGRGERDPAAEVVDAMVAELERKGGENRAGWAFVLGGWHGDRAIDALEKGLRDPDPRVRAASARAIRGPAVRSLERTAPLLVSMLSSADAPVRITGLKGLDACTYPRRIADSKGEGACAEKPTLSLLDVVPELPEAVAVFLERGEALSAEEKRIADGLKGCLDRTLSGSTGTDVGDGGS